MLQAYADVNLAPIWARRSIFGVWYRSLSGVFSFQNGRDVSCHPISSTIKRTILGRLSFALIGLSVPPKENSAVLNNKYLFIFCSF